MRKLPECNECHVEVMWNAKYFDEKRKPEPDLDGLKPILNTDGSEHVCETRSKRNHTKTYNIIPGTEYGDFNQLSLMLGNRIDGFLSRNGASLCKKGNEKVVTLRIEISKNSLPFQLKYITKPFLLEIKSQNFSQEIKKGDQIKVKCSKKDKIIFTKQFRKITLRNFMGFNYCPEEFKQCKVINIETQERLKPSRIILLLLKHKEIDIIGEEKQLIFNSDKKEIFDNGGN